MGAEETTRRRPDFGRSLRERRRAAGLSQARLAGAAGVDPSAVGSWERAERLPDLDQLRRLGTALGLTDTVLDEWVAVVRWAASPPPPPAPVVVGAFDLPPDPFTGNGGRRGAANGDGAHAGNGSAPPTGDRPAGTNGNGDSPGRSAAWGLLPSPVNGRSSSNGRSASNGRSSSNGVPSRNGGAPHSRKGTGRQRAARRRTTEPAPPRVARRRTPPPKRARPAVSTPPVATVFPTPGPAAAADPEWWVYSTAATEPWDTATRVYYFGRRLRTAVVLGGLALLAVWAFGELGEGLGAILDLMRGDPGEPTPTTVFLTG